MAILVDRTKKEFNLNDSALASESLATEQFCCVVAGGGAGNFTVGKVTGQGTAMTHVLENAPASGAMAQLVAEGICEIRSFGTFNAGVELTVHDSGGRVEAAGSGDFVVGIAREASQSHGHAISVWLVHYMKA